MNSGQHAPGDAPQIVLINGEAGDALSVLDRGLHYGDGLFETIACRHGRARFLHWHLQRLASGCERLRIASEALRVLRDEVIALAAGCEAAIIKVIVTRGSATGRGYAARGDESATRIVLRYSWPAEDPAWWRDGVVVRMAQQRLGENPALAGLKHLNRLEQVLARSEPGAAGALELLMLSSSGSLVSGTMSNVFIVRNARLLTPRIDRCGVAGVMRRCVMQEASRAGIEREECSLTVDDLNSADEIFVTNARIGIWPVCKLDARELSPGPVTRELQQLIRPLLEEPRDEREAAADSAHTEEPQGAGGRRPHSGAAGARRAAEGAEREIGSGRIGAAASHDEASTRAGRGTGGRASDASQAQTGGQEDAGGGARAGTGGDGRAVGGAPSGSSAPPSAASAKEPAPDG